jgi:hypothetical protein
MGPCERRIGKGLFKKALVFHGPLAHLPAQDCSSRPFFQAGQRLRGFGIVS